MSLDYRTCNIGLSYCEIAMMSDTMSTAAIEDREDPSGSDFRCKCGKPPVGYGSLCDARMNTRQPPYRTARPATEGQASEETVNEAVRWRGTVFTIAFFFPQHAMTSYPDAESTEHGRRSRLPLLFGGGHV